MGVIIGITREGLSSADPVDLGAQSDLIGAPKLVSTEAVLAAQIGDYRHCCNPLVDHVV